MANTSIEWTDATWNPVAGCSLASAGCKHCYAMQMAHRLESMHIDKYVGLTEKHGKHIVWNGVVKEDREALLTPHKWKKPRKIFVNSMSDLFHDKVSDDFILSVWEVMKETPQHNYQILTKRPERMRQVLTDNIKEILPNVWLGTSIENHETAYRIEHLRMTPSAVRFISFEPLIGPIGCINLTDIDWAIVGGESGSKARLIKEDWIDEIHQQCQQFNTAFFFKQWGTWGKDNQKRSKKANGRVYKGKTWNEMPSLMVQ